VAAAVLAVLPLVPLPYPAAAVTPVPAVPLARYLNEFWARDRPPAGCPSRAQIRADLGYWRPAAVVAGTTAGSRLGRFLIALLGPPAARVGDVLAWRNATLRE